MFQKGKETKLLTAKYDRLESRLDELVDCSGCHCLIRKSSAHKVEYIGAYNSSSRYCAKCEVPYKKVVMYGLPFDYYAEFSVDPKTGDPIGYKKTK